MAQYCRYCSHAHVGDWLWCEVKEAFISDYRAKKTNTCKHFDLNPIDVFGENRGEYKPREKKPTTVDGQLDFSSFLSESPSGNKAGR